MHFRIVSTLESESTDRLHAHTNEWLDKNSRIHLYFIPLIPRCLCLVERSFGELVARATAEEGTLASNSFRKLYLIISPPNQILEGLRWGRVTLEALHYCLSNPLGQGCHPGLWRGYNENPGGLGLERTGRSDLRKAENRESRIGDCSLVFTGDSDMTSASRIVVLMTCHNRINRTVDCLQSLYGQQDASLHEIDVVIVDAGSTDGTREAILERFPQAQLLERGSDLYWNGGMRIALAHAYAIDPDHYLWLNDDVQLDNDALVRMLSCNRRVASNRPAPVIVAGSTRDPETNSHTYGGVVRPDRWRPLRYELVPPGDHPKRVETMNGNCVLVPRGVVERIGNLARVFTHGMGDYDFGHRANRAGCEVWIAPGTIGTCARNLDMERAGSFAEQRRRLTSPTGGLPPVEWFNYARRWAGPFWPAYALSPYVRRMTQWGARL